MDTTFRFQLRFSGLGVGFVLPNAIPLPPPFAPLEWKDPTPVDDVYTVKLLTEPLCPSEPMVIQTQRDTQIYHTEKGWLHIYTALKDRKGCQVACLFCPNGQHILYYPASRWAEFSEGWSCTHLLCGERLLLKHDALLLHSSVVEYRGKTLLFSGPSGIGKSTQAELWKRHLGADILNGDRTVIRKTSEGFIAGGSMWSGTSGIYRRESAPIAGIFILEQGTEEVLEPLGFEAFKPLLTQTIVNSWDEQFIQKVTDLLAQLMEAVPIYRLRCRPVSEAATLVRNTLFGKEPPI